MHVTVSKILLNYNNILSSCMISCKLKTFMQCVLASQPVCMGSASISSAVGLWRKGPCGSRAVSKWVSV